jgi:ABC-type transport system substrate-binding protein
MGCHGSEARANGVLKIGILEEPKTLNIWLASDAWSNKVLSMIYQPLFIREPDSLKLVPWLASEEARYHEASRAFTVRLREARWSDGSEFTAEDVAFTGRLIKSFKVPRFYSNWKFVKDIRVIDKRTVKFILEEPRAIFLTRTLTTPIVQKKEWSQIMEGAKGEENPITRLYRRKIDKPTGTGPFVLKSWREGAFLLMERNRYFFGQGKQLSGRPLGPHISGILLKKYGAADLAILALRKGAIDFFWWAVQAGYLDDLRDDPRIKIFPSKKSALYYLGFNLRKKPFDDPHLRHAVAGLVDKDFIVERILQGYGEKMHSIIPPGNAFWHLPDVPKYGMRLTRKARMRKAYQILLRAGYTWKVPPVNAEGKVGLGERVRLPGGRPMEKFRILTPPADYDPLRAMAGIMIQEWLRMMGMPAYARPMGFGALTHRVKDRREFDLYVLGYGNLSLDPDYLRNFFHSAGDKPRGWNTSGYHHARFDDLADQSARAMDRERRRDLVWKMQAMIMEDIPWLPLYNPKLIEAVRTDRFSGWVPMLGGIGNIWTFCRLKRK